MEAAPKESGMKIRYLEDEDQAGRRVIAEKPPENYIERDGMRLTPGRPTSFIAQPTTGRAIYFEPNETGKARTREGTVPGFTSEPPPDPAQSQQPPGAGRPGGPAGAQSAMAGMEAAPIFNEPTPKMTELIGLPPDTVGQPPQGKIEPLAMPPEGPGFAQELRPGTPTLRGPYTEEEKTLQAAQEKPLAMKAKKYAEGGGLLANLIEKPFLGMFGRTLGGKIGRNLANSAELALHPERYYSLVTGKRTAPTQVEIKNAAVNTGMLSSGSPLLNALAQDLPGFAIGGDAIIASVPWLGLPLMNLQHQLLDNDQAAKEGQGPQWDMESVGESAVMGLTFRLPLPKFLAVGEGGVMRRLAQQFGGAGLRALEMSAAGAATGKQPTYEEFLNNFALMAGMKFPEAIQEVTAGRAVSKLVENGLDKQAANDWVNRAMQGDVRAEGMVRKYIQDKELAKAMGDTANFAREWRYRNTAAQDAETARQKDLARRARAGDKAAQAELASARGISANPEEAARQAGQTMPEGWEARRGEGLTPAVAGAAMVGRPAVAEVAMVGRPSGAGAVQPVTPAPIQEGEQLVTVRRPDGSTYQASFKGEYYVLRNGESKEERIASIGKLLPDGTWTHGMLAPGETILSSTMPTGAAAAMVEVKKPGPEEQAQLVDVPVHQVPLGEMGLRPDLMQFKRMDNTKSGVNELDKLEGEWDDRKAGVIQLWEPLNPAEYGLKAGQKYLVFNGHHRLDLAERSGRTGLNAQILREADGYSVHDARRLGAEINIADGKGTIYDQVKWLREYRTAFGENEAMDEGRRIGIKGRKALSIALTSGDNLYTAFLNETITPEQTELIARAAPVVNGIMSGQPTNNEPLQQIGIKLAIQGKTGPALSNYLQAIKSDIIDRPGIQLDMFGNNDAAIKEMEAKAKRATKFQAAIRDQITAVQSVAKRPDQAARLGIDVKNPKEIQAAVETLREEEYRWKDWALHEDLADIVAGRNAVEPEEYLKKMIATVSAAAPAGQPALEQPVAGVESKAEDLAAAKLKAAQDELDNLMKGEDPAKSAGLQTEGTPGPGENRMLVEAALEGGDRIKLTPKQIQENDEKNKRTQQIEAAARVMVAWSEQNKVRVTPELAGKVLGQYGDKFVPLYADIIRVANEMLATGETDLWFGMRTGKLGEAGEIGAQERPAGPEEKPAAADARRGGRTDIRVAGGQSMPTPPDYIAPKQYEVDDDQRLGINLNLDRILTQKKKGFLSGDGTGVGKTSQILVVAHEYAKRTGQKVLIITQNIPTIQGTYLSDAARLGFSLEDFDIGTYSSIRGQGGKHSKILRKVMKGQPPERVEIEPKTKYGLIILDEAHNLKNSTAKQTVRVMSLIHKADHASFFTATPMDTPTGAAYFLGEITGIPRQRMAHMLGFQINQTTDQAGEIHEKISLIKGFSWADVKKNLANMREIASGQGALIRREYPFVGTSENLNFDLKPEDLELHRRIEAYWDAVIEKLPPGLYQARMKGQKVHSLSHWVESKKVPVIFKQIKKTLAEGRRAVVVCEFVNPSDRLDRPEATSNFKIQQGKIWDKILGKKPEIVGTIEELGKLLDEAKIPYAKIYGGGPKGDQVDLFQSGKVQVVLATGISGGTGINLDDQVGDGPRDEIIASTEFAGDKDQQILGRINRRNTVNPEKQRVIDVYARGLFSEERRREINEKKLEILKRIQEGADIDLERFDPNAQPEQEEGAEELPDFEVEAAPAGVMVEGSVAPGTGPVGGRRRAAKTIEEMTDADLVDERVSDADLESDRGAAWPGAVLGEPKAAGFAPVPADDPNYSAFPVELPELVQLERAMLGGKYPEIRQKLGNALGLFSHTEGETAYPEGHIQILARIFKLITPDERRRMMKAAEGWALEHAEEKEDIVELAEQRFNKIYGEAYELAKTKNPLLASKVLAHEIGHVISWLPQHIVRGRGNILGQIASFVDYTKSQLAAMPDEQGNLLEKEERSRIRAEAQKRGKNDPKAVKQFYREAISAELKRRGIVTYKDIYAELEGLVAWWRGSDGEMEEYFERPHEMYAETMSVLLNNPAATAKRAPKFYAVWKNWLTEKPEVKRLYDAVQDSINSGKIYKDRVELMYKEMDQADQAAAEWATASNARTMQERKDAAFYTIDRRFGPIQRRLATIKDPEMRRRAFGALSDGLYRGAVGELILDRVQNEVVPRLTDNNFLWINLGEYLLHQRIQYGDRADIGNPWGFNPKASAERLAEMRKEYGPERYAALEEASLWLRSIYEQEVLAPAREWGIYGNLQQMLEDNVFYTTFAVFKDQAKQGADSFQQVLAEKFGNGVTSHLFKQYGTLKPVKNPATATVQKMLAIGAMIFRERAKFEAVNALLNSEYAAEWRPAEMQWTGKRQEIKIIENERVGTLVFMRSGKLHGFYGPRALVDAFSFRNPIETQLIARAISTGSRYIKGIFTSANPAFWPVALVRDIRRFNRTMPGTGTEIRNWIPFTGGVFGRYAIPAGQAAISTVRGKPNAIGIEALRRGMVISRAAGYMGMQEDDEFDREIKRRGLPVLVKEDQTKLDAAMNFAHKWMELGQVFERTVKISGMMYLDDKFPDMPEEIKRIIIRKWSGSPDFLEKGSANYLIDLAALFYNPAKEGVRSEWQAWKGFNGEKGRKGEMFWNMVRWTLLPRIALWSLVGGGIAAAVGRRKNDRTKWEALYQDGPSERDRRTYNCLPIMWIDEDERKALYLRWPLEENERVIAAVTDTAMQAALTGKPGEILPALTDYAGRQLPGLNPLVSLSLDWVQYAMGGNPFVQFRGKNVLTDDEQVIRGLAGLKAMGSHTWNSTLGSLLGRIPDAERSADAATTKAEKFLRAPVISQVLGRWFKISNAGYRERLEKATKPIEEQEARIRMDVERAVVNLKKTGELDIDTKTRLAQGRYLLETYKDGFLPVELSLQRYYFTHFMGETKKAALSYAPTGSRIFQRQPTKTQKLSVAGEIMSDR